VLDRCRESQLRRHSTAAASVFAVVRASAPAALAGRPEEAS
jgi:hypothetical protein